MSQRKRCCTCKKHFGLTKFNKNRSKKDGLSDICRRCANAIGRASRKTAVNKLREFLRIYLEQNPCVKCGEKDFAALQFDHIDPKTKRRNITKILSGAFSVEYLKAELKNCQVLCTNCHKLKTAQKQGWYTVRWYKRFLQGKPIDLDECR